MLQRMCTCTLQCHTSKVTFIKLSDDQLQSNFIITEPAEENAQVVIYAFLFEEKEEKEKIL